MSNKIVRTICYFTKNAGEETLERLARIESVLSGKEYTIQTKRICSPSADFQELERKIQDKSVLLGVGSVSFEEASKNLDKFFSSRSNFNIELSKEAIGPEHVDLLFRIIENVPHLTFNFAFVFNNPTATPYFPSVNYENEGFSIGLQPTDLSEGLDGVESWLDEMKKVWFEIVDLFKTEKDFLGIDSSIAPLFRGKQSLVGMFKNWEIDFEKSFTSDVYTKITSFINGENPKPVGLNGLMMPCLEDFELAEEYEKGNFGIERNIFVSLHSGLGIDTYPIGVNEDKERVLEILKLVQALSNKYNKPLSARFVSDGKAKVGDMTEFKNQYLKDAIVRPL